MYDAREKTYTHSLTNQKEHKPSWLLCSTAVPLTCHQRSLNVNPLACLLLGLAGSCWGLDRLPSQEGHSPFSSHDDHRVVLKSGKTEPINYSRGQRGQSLAWNWARSYQSAWASEGDICLWDSLTLSTSLTVCRLPLLHFQPLLLRSICSLCSCHWAVPLCASIFSRHLSLYSLRSLSCISLRLLLFFVCLCVQPPPYQLSSTDLPCLFSRILLHHPCFNISLILLPSPSNNRHLCLSLPLHLPLFLSWATCRFTHSCTISLHSDMFWSICSPTSRIG